MTTFLTLLTIATFAAIVYHYAPEGSKHGIFHLDQFRPAAPLAGFFYGDREQDRLQQELNVIASRRDDDEWPEYARPETPKAAEVPGEPSQKFAA